MFTLRKNSSKRVSLSFLQSQNASDTQQNCSSLLIADDLPRENLIFLMLNSGCFREIMRAHHTSGTQYSTASICNQICSLLVFSSREFSQSANESAEQIKRVGNNSIMDQQITVLLDAPKVPMKALRLVLRACQSALAYKIRQCVLLEQDWFVQHRVALDVILHEKYDFKVIVCPHSKLMNYIGLATLFDLQPIWSEKAEGGRQQRKTLLTDGNNNVDNCHIGPLTGKWVDVKKAFSIFFAANPSYSLSMGSPSANVSTAFLLRLMRKDRTILIELVEHDLDSLTVSSTPILQEKVCDYVDEKSQRKEGASTDAMPTVERTRLRMALIGEKNNAMPQQQQQRHSFVSDGYAQFPIGISHNRKTQKESAFGVMCSSSVGSIIERNGHWQTEQCGDEFAFSVPRLAASVRQLIDWIGEHGERRLAVMNEQWKKLWTALAGEICYLDLIQTEMKRVTEEIEEKLNELANINDGVEQLERKRQRQAIGFSEKSTELRTLGQSLHRAESLIYRLRSDLLNAYQLRIDNARRYKEAIGEFDKGCDSLLLILFECDDRPKGQTMHLLNGDQIKARIESIKGRQTNIVKCAELATETSSRFCSLLRQQREMAEQNDGYTERGENDCAEEAVLRQISADSVALNGRRQRIDMLVGLKTQKLEQLFLVIEYEQRKDQIFNKIDKSLLSENAQFFNELRQDGQILLDCARQMNSFELVLRKINNLDMRSAKIFGERLENLWAVLDRKHRDCKTIDSQTIQHQTR